MYVYKAITIKTNKMKKISLNFFGEKAEINMPTNMAVIPAPIKSLPFTQYYNIKLNIFIKI